MRSLLLDRTAIHECGFSFAVISGNDKIYTSINTYNIGKLVCRTLFNLAGNGNM